MLETELFLLKKVAQHKNGAVFNALVQPSPVIIFINQHKKKRRNNIFYYAAFVSSISWKKKLEKLLMMPFEYISLFFQFGLHHPSRFLRDCCPIRSRVYLYTKLMVWFLKWTYRASNVLCCIMHFIAHDAIHICR